jgi:hypothetical protein
VSISNSNYVAIKKAIHDKLVSELVPGSKLASIKRVGSEWLNEAKVYPYVYVGRPPHFKQDRYSSHTFKRTDDFVIGVAYRSTISLEDAQSHLDLLLDDGTGKGVLAVLNDPANYTWGGLAQYSFVAEGQSFDNLGATKTAATSEYIAYQVIRYEVTQFLTVQGSVS